MDRHLEKYYDDELGHLREVCSEFAAQFPKVSGRLDLSTDARHLSRDPYVNLLLQGVAFLAARVHHQLDAEFPRFAQALLGIIHPHFLCPVPSMAMVEFRPRIGDPTLLKGFRIPRHTVLRSAAGKGERTVCKFRTAHAVDLWPVRLESAEYVSSRAVGSLELPVPAAAVLRFCLRTDPGMTFGKLAKPEDGGLGLDRLVLHIRDDGQGYRRGPGRRALLLYEQFFRHALRVVVQWGPAANRTTKTLKDGQERDAIRRVGFEAEEALLPCDGRTFQGYRLLREYFAFPDRFLFVGLEGLRSALTDCEADEVSVAVLLGQEETGLDGGEGGRERGVRAGDFSLFATPCVNLFEQEFDRVAVNEQASDLNVVVDRSVPSDYEIYSLSRVTGYGTREDRREFRPFYGTRDTDERPAGFYLMHRVPRVPGPSERAFGRMPSYLGSEVYLSLVDALAAPYAADLRQIGFRGLCTNRGLGALISVGQADSDFFPVDFSGPFEGEIRCLAGPTPPIEPPLGGNLAWRLINHLALNHRSLLEGGEGDGVSALREQLRLYVDEARPDLLKQVDGLRKVSLEAITRRVPGPGPTTYARGLEVRLEFDEDRFPGSGPFLLGAVLEEFLARYVSINAFTETVVATARRGSLIRWPARFGDRPVL